MDGGSPDLKGVVRVTWCGCGQVTSSMVSISACESLSLLYSFVPVVVTAHFLMSLWFTVNCSYLNP